VLQRAHRANPPAEKASEQERWQQDDETEDQASIECMRRECVGDGDQRVKDEEHTHRPAHVDVRGARRAWAHRGEKQKRKEQQQKKDLRDPAKLRQSGICHRLSLGDRLPRIIGGRGFLRQ
jgi:hypothetical protein